MSQIKMDSYIKTKYIDNSKVEWLIEHGKTRQSVFFKGETGDRYTIYLFTKRNKDIVDINTIHNSYSHDTVAGDMVGYIKDYKLCINGDKRWGNWRGGSGDLVKQLMRQDVCPISKYSYRIRYCRSAYFMKTHDGNEFSPWFGMKIDLKTGLLVNKPHKDAVKAYKSAKENDKDQRKRNYVANRENTKALERYRKAGGDTESARGGWNKASQKWIQSEVGVGVDKIDWNMVPMDDVFRHRNATLRSNIIEHYGMNAILATLNHEVVDEDTIDGRHYKLLDVTIPDFSNARFGNDPVNNTETYKGLYLEMINPSTGESHFEGVPNANGDGWGASLKKATVKAALTWRDDDKVIQSGNSYSRNAPTGSEYIKPIVLK